MPAAEAFLDANILVYALSGAPDEAAKRERARRLLAEADFGLSFQVLQEVYVTATRKFARPLPPEQVLAFLLPLTRFPFVDGTPGLFLAAEALARRYRIHYYDAAIVAAARILGARLLYSEDLSHGQSYDGVRVENPFR